MSIDQTTEDRSGFSDAMNSIGNLVGNVGNVINDTQIETESEIKLEKNTMIFIGGCILAILTCLKMK